MSEATGTGRWPTRLLSANGWLVYLFLYIPIFVLIVFSFNDNQRVSVWSHFSLRWYREMLGNADVINALQTTLIVAAISTVVSTILGTAAAISMERFRFRGRSIADGTLYLPIIIPDVTMAIMMLLLFAQVINVVTYVPFLAGRFNFGIGTISLAHIAFNIAYVAVVVRARLAQMDPTLEEAAADLYASRWQTFWKVTLPLIIPGVAGGALLALTLSLDDVVVTQFVSGSGATTLPVYVFGLVRRGVTPLINAVSVVMLVASIALIAVSLGFQRRSGSKATIID